MGRFQVPWREVDLIKAEEKNIQLVRRRSGGGTVYHDLGNWNFCFLKGERELSRVENLELVVEVLKGLGVTVRSNDRYDLVFDTAEGPMKVSGSAFKQQKDRSYHHATLLVNAELQNLKGVLGHSCRLEVLGKGIKSHPSPVINLGNITNIHYEDWCNQWKRIFEVSDVEVLREDLEAVEIEREELRSWEWLWGETPENEVHLDSGNLTLKTKKGLVVEASPELKVLVGLRVKNQNCEKLNLLKSAWDGLCEEQVKILINLLKKG